MASKSPRQISDSERNVPFERPTLDKTFKNQHDCRRFVEAALRASDKENIVKTFYENGRLNPPFEFLLNCNYTLNAGTHRHSYSFQRIAVPFCALLADLEIQHLQLRTSVEELYRSVLDTDTYPFIDNCAENVLLLLNEDSPPIEENFPSKIDTGEYAPKTLSNLVEPIAHLLLACISMHSLDTSKTESVNILLDALCKANEVIRSTHSDGSNHKLLSLIQEMRPIVEHERCMISAPTPSVFCGEYIHASHTSRDPPGQISRKGPRHRFDYGLYTQISAHLATEELLSENPPYLPRLSQPCSPWIKNPWERHLDAIYRLLRHDMTNVVIKAFNQYVEVIDSIEGNTLRLSVKNQLMVCVMFGKM